MRAQFRRMETYSSVAGGAFADTRRHACLAMLAFLQLLVCTYKTNAGSPADTSKSFISAFFQGTF